MKMLSKAIVILLVGLAKKLTMSKQHNTRRLLKLPLVIGGLVSLALLTTGCMKKTATPVPATQQTTNQPTEDSMVNIIFPKLAGKPEVGKWYGVYPKGAKTALGETYHGIFKLGSSRNVMVLFNGGGVSVDAHMATEREHLPLTHRAMHCNFSASAGAALEVPSRTGQ